MTGKCQNFLCSVKLFSNVCIFSGCSFVSLDPLYSLTESDIHDRQLPEGIGARWKDLARKLGFKERSIEAIEKEHCTCHDRCIKLLVLWMEKGGQHGATAGKLAVALKAIDLQSLADRLTGILNFFGSRLYSGVSSASLQNVLHNVLKNVNLFRR